MNELLLVVAFLGIVDFVLLTCIMQQRVIIKRLARLLAEKAAANVSKPQIRKTVKVDPIVADVESALVNLGYSQMEARQAVEHATSRGGATLGVDALLRRCLAANKVVATRQEA
jgi:Holliday junction resolvasome RuvABC DNA-binding subunit